MAKLYMTIGIPGSGKSTLANGMGLPIVSSDALREELLGDVNNQDNNELVFNEMNKRISQYLKNGQDVILDAVKHSKKSRRMTIRALDHVEHETIALFFNVDPDICIRRNAARDRFVPNWKIWRFFNSLQAPEYDEGFDEIIEIISIEK